MRILICDDDEFITKQLATYLRDYFSKNHLSCPDIDTYPNGEALLEDAGEKDIVFLDVEMTGISGILTGKKLKQANPHVIIFIVTAFAEYLDEAMRFHVFRYLSKPIDKQRLFRNMKDALELYYATNQRIAVETKEDIHPIKYWTGMLSLPCFFQTHRSFIVNMEHVTDFDHTLISLYQRQFSAYLARRKYSQFKAAYLLYLESTQ